MDRIYEIQARLAAINTELDTATGDALTSLETEARGLLDELTRLEAESRSRQQLRQRIADGAVSGQVIAPAASAPQETFTLASEEYRSAFLKHLRREDMSAVEKRAFTFLTTNTAAPLPEVMQNRIIDLIGEAHPIVADVSSMDSGTAITIPVGTELSADAGKTAEGEAANELEIIFGDVSLSGEDFTANVKMSYKMLHMTIPAFEDYLVSKIAERLGAKLAADIITKIKAGMAAANKSATGITYSTICAGFGALKRVGQVITYGTRETIFQKLVGMVDDQNHPIFQQPLTADVAGAILGSRIKFEDALGAGELLIGDPKKYLQNVVAPIIIENDKDLDDHKVVFSGYTCQEGTLTDDKAFALVSQA